VSRDLFLIFGKTGGDDRNAEIRHGDGTIASIGDEKVDLRHDLCLGQDEAMRALEIAYAPFVSRLESRTAIRSREYLRTMGRYRSRLSSFLLDAGTMSVMLLASPLPCWIFLVQQKGCDAALPSDMFETPVR
jgi:hypothetical protein